MQVRIPHTIGSEGGAARPRSAPSELSVRVARVAAGGGNPLPEDLAGHGVGRAARGILGQLVHQVDGARVEAVLVCQPGHTSPHLSPVLIAYQADKRQGSRRGHAQAPAGHRLLMSGTQGAHRLDGATGHHAPGRLWAGTVSEAEGLLGPCAPRVLGRLQQGGLPAGTELQEDQVGVPHQSHQVLQRELPVLALHTRSSKPSSAHHQTVSEGDAWHAPQGPRTEHML